MRLTKLNFVSPDSVSTDTDPQPEAGVEPEPEAGVEPEPEAGVEPEPEQPELDPETAARRDAALAQIRSFGDPVLRTRARPIERFDGALRDEVGRMDAL